MLALLTTHGTLLASDGNGTPGQIGVSDAPARGRLARVANWTVPDRFQALVGNGRPVASIARAGWDGQDVAFHPDPEDPCLVRIERNGSWLRAEPDGTVRWAADPAHHGARFLPLDDGTLASLDLLLANDWVIRSSRVVVARRDIAVSPGFTLRIGELDVPIAAQDLAGQAGAPFRFLLLRDGWRIEEVRLFRPMVFYAAFRSPMVHDQLFTSLQSLFEIGGFEGRLHFFTDLDHGALRRAMPRIAAAEAVTVTPASPSDFVGFVAVKYAIVECEAARSCQPILYLDPDTVVNASLLPLLVDAALSDRLVAPIEQHRFRKVSLGRDLIDGDGGRSDQGFGVNGGTIGIPNLSDHAETLRLIRRIIVNYLDRHGRDALGWVDQEVMNYVASKLDVFDDGAISRYVRAGAPGEADAPGPSTGLVHFWATPKDQRHRLMRRYLSRLRQRARRFEPLPTEAALGAD